MAENLAGHDRPKQLSYLLDKEVRHVETSKLRSLALIIDQAKEWTCLIEELSKPRISANGKPYNLNLSLEAINLINQQLYCGKSPTLALLNHWAITGRRRPMVKTLLFHLRECNLRRAEEYVYSSILGIEPPTRVPILPPERPKHLPDEFKIDNLQELISNLETQRPRYSFKQIFESTNGFQDQDYNPANGSGYKIGEGRFSSVYRVEFQDQIVAAKLLKSDCNEKFLANEIDLIGKVKHDNILELIGISVDNCHICLIYPYMQNGSLLDCLSLGLQTMDMRYLSCCERVDIAKKIARGLSYLHERSIVHRDIKSANIFVDKDLTPKVGDFTLVRQKMTAETTLATQNIIGTSVYMPPEAFRGDISVKFDTFSFGVVLFELLTGMRPFNEDLQEDLLTHIRGRLPDDDDNDVSERDHDNFLAEIIDKKAGEWDSSHARQLFKLALRASEDQKRIRPEMSTILSNLETLMTT